MNAFRFAILLVVLIVTTARSDLEHRPPITVTALASIKGVKVICEREGGICRVTIQLDAGNEFMGANNGTVAHLTLRDEADLLVSAVDVRSRIDFPDGAMLGPFKGTSLGPSLFIEFSCRTEYLERSVIRFHNRIARGQPSQAVSLIDLLKLEKQQQGPREDKNEPNESRHSG